MLGLKQIRLVMLLVMGVILGGFLSLIPRVQAATNNNVGYNVAAKIPNNQINKQNSFFDLKMSSKKTQQLQVRVYNVTNQNIKVETAIHTAWTNTTGTIDYVKPAKSYDSTLRYKMSDLTKIQGKKTLTIPANSSKLVTANVKIPKTDFNGVILGGWYFKRVDSKVTGNVKGANNIRSQYSYVIGMKYTMGKVPNPSMNLGKVTAGKSYGRRGVIADLRNTTAVMIPNLKLATTITNRDGAKLVKRVKQENVQMAPNTTFNYPVLYGDMKLKAGHYHLHMIAKNTDHEWVFDRNFTITQAQANEYNKDANAGISIWLLVALGALGMLILILLILLIIYLIRRKRRKDDEEEA